MRYADCEDVLQDDQDDDLHKEKDQILSAFLEDRQIGLKSHGSKEKHHADLAERVVIDKLHNTQDIQDTGNDGDHQTADNRRGNAERLQNLYPLAEELPQRQNADRDSKCEIFVNFDREHCDPSLLSGCFHCDAAFLVVLRSAGMEGDRDRLHCALLLQVKLHRYSGV